MDPLTHGLASYALKRGFFSRSPRATTLAMILAGIIADLDWMSYLFGPSAFLSRRGTYTHSVLISGGISLLIALLVFLCLRENTKRSAIVPLFIGAAAAGLLHLGMDACQSAGVTLWWPLRHTPVALDWLPNLDLWILIILLAAVFLPELFHLVNREIGAKSNRPRGRSGALIGLALLFCYTGARALLHSSAVAMLQSRDYGGESPRRVAAFPDSLSPFTWHGVIETASALHTLNFSVAPGAFFDPGSVVTIHKPAPSAILDAAQNTVAAQEFLKVARFPEATVLPETQGYSVELRDLRYAALDQSVGAMQVEIDLGLAGKVTFAHLEWQKKKPRR